MIISSPKYDAVTARSLRIHSPAMNYWALDPTPAFERNYNLPNGCRLGLIKKDMGKRETKRRGWDGSNTNYGHSLSLTERFVTHPDLADVLEHFMALGAERWETTPCAGVSYYATRFDFTILQSIAFLLVHGFELHLEPDFLSELPAHWGEAVQHLQAWLSQNVIGWNESMKTLAGGGFEQLRLLSK
jgi:hypothetical protein